MDVYVRSVLQFGSVVWSPALLFSNCLQEHAQLKPLCVLYRRLLRMLLGIDSRTHNILLYILSTRVPFLLVVQKLVYRYFSRLDGL